MRCSPSALALGRHGVKVFGEPFLRWAQKRHLHLTCNFLECILELLQRRLLERQSYKVPLLPYEDRSRKVLCLVGQREKKSFSCSSAPFRNEFDIYLHSASCIFCRSVNTILKTILKQNYSSSSFPGLAVRVALVQIMKLPVWCRVDWHSETQLNPSGVLFISL